MKSTGCHGPIRTWIFVLNFNNKEGILIKFQLTYLASCEMQWHHRQVLGKYSISVNQTVCNCLLYLEIKNIYFSAIWMWMVATFITPHDILTFHKKKRKSAESYCNNIFNIVKVLNNNSRFIIIRVWIEMSRPLFVTIHGLQPLFPMQNCLL